MLAPSETGIRLLRRLSRRVAESGALSRRTGSLDLNEFVPRVHALKEGAYAGAWTDLADRASTTAMQARHEAARRLGSLRDLAALRVDLIAIDRLLGSSPDPRLASVRLRETRELEIYDAYLALGLDALRADAIARFHRTIAGSASLGADAGISDRLATEHQHAWNMLLEVKRALAEHEVDTAVELLDDAQDRTREIAIHYSQIAALLVRDPDAPFSRSGDGIPRLWAARAARDSSTIARTALAIFAISGVMLRQLNLDPDTAQEEAVRLSEQIPLLGGQTGQTLTVEDATQLEVLDGERLVHVEGLVTAARHQTDGAKRDTFLTIRHLTDPGGPTLAIRAHFVNLPSRGIVAGSFVRCTGFLRAHVDWNDGARGLELMRGRFANSESWLEQRLHQSRAIMAMFPEGTLIEWSPVPWRSREHLGVVADMWFAPELRLLLDGEENG